MIADEPGTRVVPASEMAVGFAIKFLVPTVNTGRDMGIGRELELYCHQRL